MEPRERPKASGLQSLAAELHQAALQGIFDYPRSWTLVARTTAAVLVALAVFHLAMVVIPLTRVSGSIVETIINWRVLGAAIGSGVALAAAALIANLFQKVQVTPEGLGIMEITGWRRIPWKQVQVLRVMEIAGQERYMVMIPFTGRTLPPSPAPALRIIQALAGAGTFKEQGVLLSSHMANFERLLQLIVSYMAQEAGQIIPTIEAYVDEHAVMPTGQILLGHEAAIARLARTVEADHNPYGMPVEQKEFDLPWDKILPRQALIAAAPVLMFLLDTMLRNGEKPVQAVQGLWALVILALGVAELPFVAVLTRTVGELTVGSGQFKRTVWAHLELQLPRAAFIIVGATLLGLGVPIGFALLAWILGIGATTLLVSLYVMRLHHLVVHQTLLATVGTFIFQAVVMVLYFGVR
jgi:hypothetical protein